LAATSLRLYMSAPEFLSIGYAWARDRHLHVLAGFETGRAVWGDETAADEQVTLVGVQPASAYHTIRDWPTEYELPEEMQGNLRVVDINYVLKRYRVADPDWLPVAHPTRVVEAYPANHRSAQEWGERLAALADRHAAPRSLAHHYSEHAARLAGRYLRSPKPLTRPEWVDLLRAVGSMNWVLAGKRVPPLTFSDLVADSNGALGAFLQSDWPAIPTKGSFPVSEAMRDELLDAVRKGLALAPEQASLVPDDDLLDAAFRDALQEASTHLT